MNRDKNRGFYVAGITERLALEQFKTLRNDFEITKLTRVKSFDKYDAIIESGVTMMVEVKVRKNYAMKRLPTWIIEKEKYDTLMLNYKNTNQLPIYITIVDDGIMLWDLSTASISDWKKEYLPKNSQNGNEELIEKITGDLNLCEAHIYNIILPLDKLKQQAEYLYEQNRTRYNDAYSI